MRKILCLVFLGLLCSCSTVLNTKNTRVNIYAPNNTEITYDSTTVKVTNSRVSIFPKRSKDSLKLRLSIDSIAADFAFDKRISTKYLFNFLCPPIFYLGYLVDLTNPKRFSYKSNLHFNIDSTTNTFKSLDKKPIIFKKNDVFVYTTPLKAIDLFSQPMLSVGVEYFARENLSISAEYGTVFTGRLGGGRNPRNRLVEDKGRAFRYELKGYNLFKRNRNPRTNYYFGLEALFLRYQFNEDISYTRTLGTFNFPINETYIVQQSVDIFNIKYGINYPIGEHLFIDVYYGLGLRIINFENPNRIYNPDIDTIVIDDNGFLDFSRNSYLEKIDDTRALNITLGFKFGYKF